MKTILFKIRKFPLLSETFIVNQIVMSLQLGYEVKVLVDELVDPEESKQKEVLEKHRILERIYVVNYAIPKDRLGRLMGAIKIILLNILSIKQLLHFFILKKKQLSSFFEFEFYSKFSDVDLVHIQYGTNARAIANLKLSGKLKMPVILTFHGHDAFFPINGFIKQEGYYDRIFQVAKLITVNTEYLKNQLLKIGGPEKKLKIVPIPVDTEFFSPGRSHPKALSNPIKLLSVGRLEKIKGHDLALKVVQILHNKAYKVSYTLVGDGKCRKELESLVEKMRLQNVVNIIGEKSHKEIRGYYRDSDIFLMPSRPVQGGIRETQGLVTLEAQACGLPIVAFDSGGIKYTFKDKYTGLLVRENDIEHFAQQVERLINSPDLFLNMRNKAPLYIQANFSRKEIIRRWKEIYKLKTNV